MILINLFIKYLFVLLLLFIHVSIIAFCLWSRFPHVDKKRSVRLIVSDCFEAVQLIILWYDLSLLLQMSGQSLWSPAERRCCCSGSALLVLDRCYTSGVL